MDGGRYGTVTGSVPSSQQKCGREPRSVLGPGVTCPCPPRTTQRKWWDVFKDRVVGHLVLHQGVSSTLDLESSVFTWGRVPTKQTDRQTNKKISSLNNFWFYVRCHTLVPG